MKNKINTDVTDRKGASEILSVSVRQVERFRRQGKLPYIKLAKRCIRYRVSDCEALLNACTINGGICNG